MKQKIKKYLFVSLVMVSIAVFGVTSVVFFTGHDRADAVADTVQAQSSITSSKFSFAGAENWTKGPLNETSIAVFHRGNDGCFVSAEYKTDSLDEASALEGVLQPFITTGYGITSQGDITTHILVDNEQQGYQLHQYAVKATDATPEIKEGNEFGFISVENGYIKIEGHCDISADFPVTIPALQSITFDSTK